MGRPEELFSCACDTGTDCVSVGVVALVAAMKSGSSTLSLVGYRMQVKR